MSAATPAPWTWNELDPAGIIRASAAPAYRGGMHQDREALDRRVLAVPRKDLAAFIVAGRNALEAPPTTPAAWEHLRRLHAAVAHLRLESDGFSSATREALLIAVQPDAPGGPAFSTVGSFRRADGSNPSADVELVLGLQAAVAALLARVEPELHHHFTTADGQDARVDLQHRHLVEGHEWRLGQYLNENAWSETERRRVPVPSPELRNELGRWLPELIAETTPLEHARTLNGDPLDCRAANIGRVSACISYPLRLPKATIAALEARAAAMGCSVSEMIVHEEACHG